MRARRVALAFPLFVLFTLAPSPAFAYIDPGTGSFLFQVVAAAVIGGLFFVRTSWQRIRNAIKRLFAPRRDG